MQPESLHPTSTRPLLRRATQLLALPGGGVCARIDERTVQIDGIPAQTAGAIARLCDGRHTIDAIQQALAPIHAPTQVAQLIEVLYQAGVLEDHSDASVDPQTLIAQPQRRRICLLGNHDLLSALDAAFASAGFEAVRCVRVRHFNATADAAIDKLRADCALATSAAAAPTVSAGGETLDQADPQALHALLGEAEFAVCAFEDVAQQTLFELGRLARDAGTPCLFLSVGQQRGIVGPTVVGAASPCYRCRVLGSEPLARVAADLLPLLHAPRAVPGSALLARVAASAVDEARATLARPPAPLRADSILIMEAGHEPRRESLLPAAACPDCRDQPAPAPDTAASAARVRVAAEIAQVWLSTPTRSAQPAPDAYRSVNILGGGTAGYLAALALRSAHPHLDITVVESSTIPVIGVGEATTPELVRMLHSPQFLGFDVADFHRRVQPTFKLGIQFQWGRPAPYEFPYPFQRGRLAESWLHAQSFDAVSLGAMLMARKRVPIFDGADGAPPVSLLHRIRWAYHLDNRRFVGYLREQALARGIKHLDAIVDAAEVSADGQNISTVITRDGQRLQADLWVDCSGFRSLLMGGKLGSAFIDYSSSLFTDRAIAANVRHDGIVKPYTHSRTMDAGWCWTIPFEDADHLGYVYASAFMDEDRALAEMRALHPELENPWPVRFRSGRHEHFWRGNLIALGNAYGFVEPLQSTALHMLVFQLELLNNHFPASRREHHFKTALNRKVGERWDALRWFLATHYRFNKARDSEFWRAANAEADISGARQRVELFRERAPLSARPSFHYRYLPPEFFSDDHAFDSMLMGLGVESERLDTVEDAATWQRLQHSQALAADLAMPQADALPWLREHGADALAALTDTDSWIRYWYPV